MSFTLSSNTQRQLLSLIYVHSPVTRAELSVLSGLTPAAVTKNTKSMIESNWIAPVGKQQSERGQPGITLALNRNKGFSLGINIEAEKISLQMVNLNSETVFSKSIRGIYDDPIYSRDELFSLIDVLKLAYPKEFDGLIGVGVTTSCNFLGDDKVMFPNHLKQWENICIRDEIENHLKTDVWLENDGNAAALGEYIVQKKQIDSNLFYLYLGYGIGGGHLHNGIPYRGHRGNAGRIGKMFPISERRPSLNDLYQQLGLTELNPRRYQELLQQLHDCNPTIEEWIHRFIPDLKNIVHSIKNVLDPKEIILGGLLPKLIFEKIYQELKAELIDLQEDNEPLLNLNLALVAGDKSATLGAAVLPLYKKIYEYS